MADEAYRNKIRTDVLKQLSEFPGQPVLFVGAGLTRRWFDAPTWRELLEMCIEQCLT